MPKEAQRAVFKVQGIADRVELARGRKYVVALRDDDAIESLSFHSCELVCAKGKTKSNAHGLRR